MSETKAEEPDYGNWVSKKLVYVPGSFGLLFLVLSFLLLVFYIQGEVGLLSVVIPLAFLISAFAAVVFFSMSVYFAYARRKFSQRGGNIQARIQELVVNRLDWDGKGQALDIGCGNAPLTIAIAKKFPRARITGIDYWGGAWEYSKGSVRETQRLKALQTE